MKTITISSKELLDISPCGCFVTISGVFKCNKCRADECNRIVLSEDVLNAVEAWREKVRRDALRAEGRA